MSPPDTPTKNELIAQIRCLDQENVRLRQALETARAVPVHVDHEHHRSAQAILDHLPSMIGCWDKQLRYRYANRAYKTWFGLDPEQMQGMTLREVIGEERYRLNRPYIEGALRGEPQTFERAIPSPDGKHIRHSLAHYVPDIERGEVKGFFVLVSDITAVKAAESLASENQELLRKNEELYRAVVQDQTEAISRLRADGTYLFANSVFHRFFGTSQETLIGSKWHPLVYSDDLVRVGEEIAQLGPDNPVVMIENRVYSAAGDLHWMQFSNRGLFNEAGELVEIQSVGRDITDRKRTEASLQSAHAELQRRVEQLRQLAIDATLAEERERKIIANELHDGVGQILHVVKLKLDGLAKRLPPEVNPAVDELDLLVGEASRMVRSLTSQISPPVLKDLGLVPALRWLAEEMERHYDLDVLIEDDGHHPPLGEAQAATVFRTTRELLINIAKHSGVDSAQLKIAQHAGALHITVRDDGCGMSAPTAHSHSGSRGLASVRERIDFLGGAMCIRSAPGQGTTISFHIPVRHWHQVNGAAGNGVTP